MGVSAGLKPPPALTAPRLRCRSTAKSRRPETQSQSSFWVYKVLLAGSCTQYLQLHLLKTKIHLKKCII